MKWLARLIFGESTEEYFERNPEAHQYVDREGRSYANPKRIGELIDKWRADREEDGRP